VLLALCALAGLLVAFVLVDVAYQVVNNARPSISRFGTGFLAHQTWAPNLGVFGAAELIFGTLVSSAIALALATPLGIAIGLYLATMAAPGVRAVVGAMVEMLAAIPSVIIGFWGVIVFAPFLQRHVEPALHSALGFIPVFGPPQTTGLSLFTAGLILTLMILPIISALSRDLFLTVPVELREGAAALGATRWEIIRGVILPTTAPGVAAAAVLGLGRALGEAIAVAQVVGDGSVIHASMFEPGATMASRIANDFLSATTKLFVDSLFYLAVVLLVISLLTTLAARAIAGRFDVQRVMAR
jgi:phosphate transport system permease protein